jgi:hypothetical protein
MPGRDHDDMEMEQRQLQQQVMNLLMAHDADIALGALLGALGETLAQPLTARSRRVSPSCATGWTPMRRGFVNGTRCCIRIERQSLCSGPSPSGDWRSRCASTYPSDGLVRTNHSRWAVLISG